MQNISLKGITLSNQMPYVDKSSFAHLEGVHISDVAKVSTSFEQVSPMSVGNEKCLEIIPFFYLEEFWIIREETSGSKGLVILESTDREGYRITVDITTDI